MAIMMANKTVEKSMPQYLFDGYEHKFHFQTRQEVAYFPRERLESRNRPYVRITLGDLRTYIEVDVFGVYMAVNRDEPNTVSFGSFAPRMDRPSRNFRSISFNFETYADRLENVLATNRYTIREVEYYNGSSHIAILENVVLENYDRCVDSNNKIVVHISMTAESSNILSVK